MRKIHGSQRDEDKPQRKRQDHPRIGVVSHAGKISNSPETSNFIEVKSPLKKQKRLGISSKPFFRHDLTGS
jgi:hypothetical protein